MRHFTLIYISNEYSTFTYDLYIYEYQCGTNVIANDSALFQTNKIFISL